MNVFRKKIIKRGLLIISGVLLMIILISLILIIRTWGKTAIQVDIRQNMDIIHLSTFGEPPQFAIWLEEPETGDLKTIFVTHRVAEDDWEGKAAVPGALPQWTHLFRSDRSGSGTSSDMVVTGATPKEDYFSIRADVPPGSEWIFWIEMNLAGDFNEAFPEMDVESYWEDEYARGQPSLIYRTEIKAVEDMVFTPVLEAQSTLLDDGNVKIEPVSDGVTTAKYVFDTIQVSIIKPKPRLIDKYKVDNY